MRPFNATAVPRPSLPFAFPLKQTVDLEIGAGQGLHAIQYCQRNPDRILLAVEKTHARFERLQGRHQTHGKLTNLIPIHADAAAFVTHFVPDHTLDRVFLLYPNPYPKMKQANLRWHNRPFFAELLKKMRPGAELTLATNLEWYAREAHERLAQQWRLELLDTARFLGEPRTHFEKK